MLMVARVLQGCSSAVVWTVGMAVLAETLPPERLGVAMGTVGSVVSLGMVSSPVLGGTIFHAFGYQAVFWVLGGMLVVDVFLRLMMIERKDAEKWGVVVVEPEPETVDENTALINTPSPVRPAPSSMLKLFLVYTSHNPDLVSPIFDGVMDGIYEFHYLHWTFRRSSTPPSQTHILVHGIDFRRNICYTRRPRDDPWSRLRLASRPLRK